MGVLHGLSSMSGPLAERPLDLSINGLGLNTSRVLGRFLARAFDFFFPDVALDETLPFKLGRFDFIVISQVTFNQNRMLISTLEDARSFLKSGGFLVVSRAGQNALGSDNDSATGCAKALVEAGFESIEEAPIIPTLGVPRIPDPDIWIAYAH